MLLIEMLVPSALGITSEGTMYIYFLSFRMTLFWEKDSHHPKKIRIVNKIKLKDNCDNFFILNIKTRLNARILFTFEGGMKSVLKSLASDKYFYYPISASRNDSG